LKTISFYFIQCLIVISFALSTTTNAQQTLYGDSITMGDGLIYTWVHYNAGGTRDLIAVSLTPEAFNNLPSSSVSESLALPRLGTDTLFNHIYLNWNPGGHPPPGIYTLPHFDFHFVMVSNAERQAVIPGLDPVVITSEFRPLDYIPDSNPPMSVPAMGTHYVDSTSPEFHGQTFTKTFVYGFYRGKMFFLEPMITRAYFLTNPNDLLDIKQPVSYLRTGYFPTRYTIIYDAVSQRYNIILRDFVFRISPIGIQNIGLNIPTDFAVYQNFPNPFNPVTNIKFDIPRYSFVKLIIFNSLGQEIDALVNQELTAGSYKVDWDAANFPSGVYYYKIQTNEFQEAKSMMLIK